MSENKTVDVEVQDLQETGDKPLVAVMEYKDFAIELYEATDEVFKFKFTRGLFKGMEYSIDAKTLNVLPEVDDPAEKMLEMEITILDKSKWYAKVEEMIYQLAASDIVARLEKYLKKPEEKKEEETVNKDE